MCGIVGAVARRDVTPILLEGLKRLEYRGYDSAGIAVVGPNNDIQRLRTKGKVKELEEALIKKTLPGNIGIAHTRWATHGKP
jgi:glucosamine--fructose-6-phosphate aminotransferase (isomerizing)